MLNRMLKVMELIIAHDIEINEELERNFYTIASKKDQLVDAFQFTKDRIK